MEEGIRPGRGNQVNKDQLLFLAEVSRRPQPLPGGQGKDAGVGWATPPFRFFGASPHPSNEGGTALAFDVVRPHREATRKRIKSDLGEYVAMARALAGITS